MRVEARSLRFRWEPGAVPAVDGVSLAAGGGELVAVVGPNGAGKSTLLALLAGWIRPVAGTVALDGRPLATYSGRERARRIAYLPQQVVPLYDLTVGELAATGRHPWGGPLPGPPLADPAVARALEATGLRSLAGRPLAALSGGERQRALLASVLAQETPALLLDEPTAALDLHHAVAIFRLLARQAAAGRTVLTVTHDLTLAAQFADRIVLLDRGREAASGPPSAVLTEAALRATYGPEVLVRPHPETGRPAVLPRRGAP